jgi:stage V sporulation protein SpoVS
MPHCPAPDSSQDAVLLEAAADQAIAACGGNMREAIKALIVANDFLETEVTELMRAVSQAYVRGRFKPYNG